MNVRQHLGLQELDMGGLLPPQRVVALTNRKFSVPFARLLEPSAVQTASWRLQMCGAS
jgi:hypothetical protein